VSALIREVHYPFAKGSLTTDGIQYSTPVTGVDNDEFDEVEAVVVTLPDTVESIEELEFGLAGAVEVDGSGSTDDILWKWQVSDDGETWEDLIAEQTKSNTNTFTDVYCSGRFKPVGDFAASGRQIHARMVVKSGGATDTVSGKARNSSYMIVAYRTK
jgi:hypothetical protein